MGKLFKRDSEKPAERKPADIQGKVNTNPKTGAILSGEQKQRIVKQKLKEKKNSNIPKTCQDTIVYKEIYKDGICRVTDTLYNKTLRFGDINYQLAQNEDKTAAFESWCDFYNYFDSSIFLQISCVSHYANAAEREKQIDIPLQGDEFDAIRDEYVTVLKTQLSKGNNGLVRDKYITFGIEADSIRTAKPRLERIETDIINKLKVMGVTADPLSGFERLKLLYQMMNENTEDPFVFNYDMVTRTGLSTKDFIAPTSFDFRDPRYFRMGKSIGAVSYIQILAPEIKDNFMSDLLSMDNSIAVNIHVQSMDQTKAIRQIKGKITDLDKMKIEEQKKAVRSGYDMDVLPSDLVTYGGEAKKLLEDLQSRNELRTEEAGLSAGTGTDEFSAAGYQPDRYPERTHHLLCGGVCTIHHRGTVPGWRGTLLRHQCCFQQHDHGRQEKDQEPQRADTRHSGFRQVILGKTRDRERVHGDKR